MNNFRDIMIAGGTDKFKKDEMIRKLQEENEKLRSENKVLRASIKTIKGILKEDD